MVAVLLWYQTKYGLKPFHLSLLQGTADPRYAMMCPTLALTEECRVTHIYDNQVGHHWFS